MLVVVVNTSSEAACGYPFRNHCNTLSLSTTKHSTTLRCRYLNTHTYTHTLTAKKQEDRSRKGEEEKTGQKEGER